jgi:hypothetical protein
MGMDIDIYEFKETIKQFEDDSFIKFSEEKGVAVIEVGKTNKATDKKLLDLGYKKGDKVLVVVQ